MNEKRTFAGHLAAMFTIFVWGTTFVSTKILLQSFEPVEILFLRFLLGFFALALARPVFLKTKGFEEERFFLAAGLCGVTLYFLLENIALTFTLASNVGVILSTAPFFTALASYFFLKGERPGKRFFLGFLIAMAGIVLIGFNGSFVLKINPAGDLLSVLAALVWAFYSVLTRKIGQFGYPVILTTRRVFLYGLLFMIPALFLLGFHPQAAEVFRPLNLGNLLFLGLGASAVCFVTWGWAVGVLGAVKTSAYIYLSPVLTIVFSALILKEPVTAVSLAGAGLTLLGLAVSEGTCRGRAAPEPVPGGEAE